jgi:hypothetical protein
MRALYYGLPQTKLLEIFIKNQILDRNLPIDGVKQILRTGISAIKDFLLVSVKKEYELPSL